MRAKLEITKRKGKIFASYKGSVYEFNSKIFYSEVLPQIEEKKKELNRYLDNIIKDASSLGVIIIPTTVDGRNPYQVEFENFIERILREYSLGKNISLENYL